MSSAQPSANTLYRAEQTLIRLGQPVFPCKIIGEKAKAPLTKNGLLDASTDLGQVKAWRKRFGAQAAIGIPTGILWDVLDVDVKEGHDGRVHLPYLKKIGLLNGCKFVVRTPSGGWHLYFTAAPGLTNKGRGGSLGLDVRAKGGYVLAPPSWIETPKYAGSYEDVGETIGGTDEPLRWDLILNSIAPLGIDKDTKQPTNLLPSERRASIASLREWTANLNEGERNNGFHWAVSRCIENGIDPHELVEPAMLIGLGEEEINKTIGSALRRSGLSLDQLDTEAEALFPETD